MKNVIMIMSGGVGSRLGANIPKQYLEINNRMVIDYVIEAAKNSKLADEIIIVANGQYVKELHDKYGLPVTEGGSERNQSMQNGLDYIADNYECGNVLVVDAVRPLVSGKLYDGYFVNMKGYDIVATASKITDSLSSYDMHEVDRSRYYLLSSPECFNFKKLRKYFNKDSALVEVSQQFPEDTKIYLDFSFPFNYKLTYSHDKIILESLLNIKNTLLGERSDK